MLDYDYKARYTAEECLNHPFLREIRQKSTLVQCEKAFDFSFDDIPMEIPAIREAIYVEAQTFHSEAQANGKRPRIENQEQRDQEGHPNGSSVEGTPPISEDRPRKIPKLS
jgi:serine/threonine protein kinase